MEQGIPLQDRIESPAPYGAGKSAEKKTAVLRI